MANCPACLAADTAFAFDSLDRDFSKSGYRYFRCNACRTVFIGNPPVQAALDRMYREDAFTGYTHRQRAAMEAYPTSPRAALDRSQYLEPIRRHATAGRFLEIGCGSGWLTHLLAEAGFDATGVDLNADHIATAESCLKGTFRNAGLEALDGYGPASLDGVALMSLLEHVRDPDALVGRIAERLRPGGLAAFVVPSVDSLQFKALGQHYYWAMAPYHITLFSRDGLTRLLARAGLAPCEFVGIRRNWYWTKALVDKNGLTERYLELRKNSDFVEFDKLVDGLFDEVADMLDLSSAFLVLAAKEPPAR